jgi:hypothetical protein
MPSVERSFYYDMLGAPHADGGRSLRDGIDCLGVAWLVLKRIHGEECLEGIEDWKFGQLTADSAALLTWKMQNEDRWRIMSRGYICKTKRAVGDVVLQMIGPERNLPHVSVVVYCGPNDPLILLTSDRKRGVRAVAERMIGPVHSVYRLIPK